MDFLQFAPKKSGADVSTQMNAAPKSEAIVQATGLMDPLFLSATRHYADEPIYVRPALPLIVC